MATKVKKIKKVKVNLKKANTSKIEKISNLGLLSFKDLVSLKVKPKFSELGKELFSNKTSRGFTLYRKLENKKFLPSLRLSNKEKEISSKTLFDSDYFGRVSLNRSRILFSYFGVEINPFKVRVSGKTFFSAYLKKVK